MLAIDEMPSAMSAMNVDRPKYSYCYRSSEVVTDHVGPRCGSSEEVLEALVRTGTLVVPYRWACREPLFKLVDDIEFRRARRRRHGAGQEEARTRLSQQL